MSVVRCPKGHFYDDQRFSHCPHCGVFSEPSGGGDVESDKSGQSSDCLDGLTGRRRWHFLRRRRQQWMKEKPWHSVR